MTGVPQATLLLTRPRAQSDAFLAQCEARLNRSVPAVLSPIIDVCSVGEVPKLDKAGTIILTSTHAVHRLDGALGGRRVAVVGRSTAETVRQKGGTVVAVAETAQQLLNETERFEEPVVICRGVHARVNIEAELKARGIAAQSHTIYDQRAQPLSQLAQDLLSGTAIVIAPVFSPRSASLLSAVSIAAPISVLAMSEAVAEAWQGPGKVLIAERPDALAMVDLVAQTL